MFSIIESAGEIRKDLHSRHFCRFGIRAMAVNEDAYRFPRIRSLISHSLCHSNFIFKRYIVTLRRGQRRHLYSEPALAFLTLTFHYCERLDDALLVREVV